MAPFDLHEVIIGHIKPEICRRMDNSVTIVRIGLETNNFQGFLVIPWWFKPDIEPIWVWPFLTLEGHQSSLVGRISAFIVHSKVEAWNFQGFLVILLWCKFDIEHIWLWPCLTLTRSSKVNTGKIKKKSWNGHISSQIYQTLVDWR